MNLGLENKRNTAILGGLVLLCGYMLYTNVLAGPSLPTAASAPAAAAAAGDAPPTIAAPSAPTAPRAPVARGRNEEFHPALRPKRQEDRPDLSKIDPQLHLELLAKLQKVAEEGGGRNLFQSAPPPPPPEKKGAGSKSLDGSEPIVPGQKLPAAPSLPSTPPPPPPPPFKYYGVITERLTGRKTAFFLEGDDIYKAAEGELVKKRYRVVRIGVNSVVLEDTELKRQSTLQLAEDANAG
jgi:hypothetical protein